MASVVAVDSGRRSGLRRWVVGAVIALWEALGGRLFKGHVVASTGPARVVVGAADISPADGLLRDALGAVDGLGRCLALGGLRCC